MHVLVNRAIEKFLQTTSGFEIEAGLVRPGVMLQDAAQKLGKPVDELAEDLGAWLVQQNQVWRLLRFCGSDFLDFLLRLDEVPDRIRLITEAVPVPQIALSRGADGFLWVTILHGSPLWLPLLAGLLRAMADDYGTLCVITRTDEGICIDVSDAAFAQARTFSLSGRVSQP